MDLTHPMDLTVGSQSTADVIVLSDGGAAEDRATSDLPQRARMIRRLREELRNEDATLVLLKKIRQSQAVQQFLNVQTPGEKRTPPPSAAATGATVGGATVHGTMPVPVAQVPVAKTLPNSSHRSSSQRQRAVDIQVAHQSARQRNTPSIPTSASNSTSHRNSVTHDTHQNAQQRQVQFMFYVYIVKVTYYLFICLICFFYYKIYII